MSTNLMTANQQWATRPSDQRFETLEQLKNSVHSRRMRSRSVDVDIGTVCAREEGGTIVLNRGMKSVEPTHWSFGQMAGWIKAPAGYLRALPPGLAVQCINHGIAAQPRETLKFMAVTEERENEINTLQAVTSTTYGRIWDADVVDCASRIVERTNGKFHNPLAYDMATGKPKPQGLYASDRDVFIFMIDGGSLLEAGPRAQLHRGFFLWNSEVGSRSFGLTTFMFNVVCGNHIVWGAQDIRELRIRHTANGPYRFDSEAAPQLLAYANSSANQELDAIKRAQEYLIPGTLTEDRIRWLTERKFTRSEAREAIKTAEREEGQAATLWDIVQGLTAYARGMDYVDARVDLETRAGQLLNIAANS